MDRGGVDLGGRFHQRPDLGGERKPFPVDPVVQRLDPQPVPAQNEALTDLVPDRECEHAAQVAGQIGAVFFVEVDQNPVSVSVRN